MNATISLNDIALHVPSKRFGRVWAVDHFNKTLTLNNAKSVPESECVYLGAVWKDAWAELDKYNLSKPTPPPPNVVVTVGAYTATVEYRHSFAHLSCTFLGKNEPLINSFVDPDHILALGRVLVTACRPVVEKTTYYGWDWNFGEATNTGWITLQYQKIPLIPDTFTLHSGYECGIALVQLGAILKARREIVEWIGIMNMPSELAV